jgi:hypothetical protein
MESANPAMRAGQRPRQSAARPNEICPAAEPIEYHDKESCGTDWSRNSCAI